MAPGWLSMRRMGVGRSSCGIGNAEAFRTLVQRQRGITVADAIVFPDHHVYTSADMGHVHERAERAGASLLVTTEKDAVKFGLCLAHVARLGGTAEDGHSRRQSAARTFDSKSARIGGGRE